MSVLNLMASPLAVGLFDRAIVQSGGFTDFGMPAGEGGNSLKDAEMVGELIASDLGVDERR